MYWDASSAMSRYAAIPAAHDRPGRPYGTEIDRIFEKCPQIAKQPFIFKAQISCPISCIGCPIEDEGFCDTQCYVFLAILS